MEIDLESAKARFADLLERVALGEEVIITKAGTPVAQLVAVKEKPARGPRQLGTARGEIVVPDDFDDPLPEFEEEFYRPEF